jgi:methylated-DNA-protein-cysteine methyltransferase-like protein
VHNCGVKSPQSVDPEAGLEAIRAVVASLQPGEIVTYGGVAARAGLPGRARLVGRALRTAPAALRLPWHRVVGAGGRIAFPVGSAAAEQQAQRLRAEGVAVIGRRAHMPVTSDLDALLWGAPVTAKMQHTKRGGHK